MFSFTLLGCSVSFTLDRVVSALNWCSSMEFTSAPLSGSALTSTSSIFIDTVLSSLSVLIFFTCFRCLTAWQKNSSSELAELSASSSSVVLFTRRLHCALNSLVACDRVSFCLSCCWAGLWT